MLEVVLNCSVGWCYRLDPFGLAFLDHSSNVLGDVLAQGEDTPVSDWSIWPEERWYDVKLEILQSNLWLNVKLCEAQPVLCQTY